MAPYPNGAGEDGSAGHGGGGGGSRELTAGEIVAIVLSCVFGPGILWMLFICCCVPTCVMILHASDKRSERKLQREAALRTSIHLGEQAQPVAPAGGDYFTPTASVIAPVPPAAQGH